MYKLRSWINESSLTKNLSLNEHAVEYLEDHVEKIDYYFISQNINAIHIIEKNLDKCEHGLNNNSNMINVLRNNKRLITPTICNHEHGIEFAEELIKANTFGEIVWANLSGNCAAIHILEQYPEKIKWYYMIYNKNAENLIRNNLEKVEDYWSAICRQPHLISLIETYPEKIKWRDLSSNCNAIHLLKNNLNKIHIGNIRFNKNGFELLILLNHQFSNNLNYDKHIVYEYWNYCKLYNIEFTLIRQLCEYGYTDEHIEFIKNHPIDYNILSQNPHIFIYDYSRMKKTRQQQPWYNNIKNEFI